MEISTTTLWIVSALILLGVEMFIGSVYILAIAAGLLVGGLFSFFDFSFSIEVLACSLTILAASAAIILYRRRLPKGESEALMNPDAGRLVEVTEVDPDGTATVRYRGAPWKARLASGALTPGFWAIERVSGAELVVRPAPKDEH